MEQNEHITEVQKRKDKVWEFLFLFKQLYLDIIVFSKLLESIHGKYPDEVLLKLKDILNILYTAVEAKGNISDDHFAFARKIFLELYIQTATKVVGVTLLDIATQRDLYTTKTINTLIPEYVDAKPKLEKAKVFIEDYPADNISEDVILSKREDLMYFINVADLLRDKFQSLRSDLSRMDKEEADKIIVDTKARWIERAFWALITILVFIAGRIWKD